MSLVPSFPAAALFVAIAVVAGPGCTALSDAPASAAPRIEVDQDPKQAAIDAQRERRQRMGK